jgi:hypothetical protein
MKRILVAVVFAFAVPLAACATSQSVQTEGASGGVTKAFPAKYAAVKAAALESVQKLNVKVQKTSEDDKGFHITFSKPISAFSWGEVGQVDVVKSADDAATDVVVNTSKRLKTQVTGTSQKQFAEQIFADVTANLARYSQQ